VAASGHGQQRTDSTHVLARSRALSRAECVVETLRHALNILSVVTPDWLQNHVQPDWLVRYGPRASEFGFPSEEDKRQQFLHQVGQDGWGLLSAIATDPHSQWMLSIPAVDTLHRICKQDYLPQEQAGTWRADQDRLEAARLFFSPYDLDASAAKKRSTYWIGYKVHFTETCDEDRPHLITHVVTDIGPIPDRDELPEIHAALQRQELLPHHHLVDAGYVDAEALLASQTEYHVDLVGPTAQDHRWQAREQKGYALPDFFIDWEHKQARCPQGQISSSWTPKRHAESGSHQDQVWLCYLWSLRSRGPSAPNPGSVPLPFAGAKHMLPWRLLANVSRQKNLLSCMRSRAGIEGAHGKASAANGTAPVALHWRATHTLATCGNCCCHQLVSII